MYHIMQQRLVHCSLGYILSPVKAGEEASRLYYTENPAERFKPCRIFPHSLRY
jgi:hypothetical protein